MAAFLLISTPAELLDMNRYYSTCIEGAQTIPPAASNHLTRLKSGVYACNPVSQDAEAGGTHV